MSARVIRRAIPVGIGIVCLVAIGLLPVSLPTADITSTLESTPVPGASGTPAHPTSGSIFAGSTMIQEFPAGGTAISAVKLVLATDRRTNRGTIQVTMQAQTNNQWRSIGSQTLEKSAIASNTLSSISFDPPLDVRRGQPIRIVLQADGNEQTAVTWSIDPSSKRAGFALYRNDEPLPGTAEFQVSYADTSGRLVTMIGPIWKRVTVFLSPIWRIILVVAVLTVVASLVIHRQSSPSGAVDR